MKGDTMKSFVITSNGLQRRKEELPKRNLEAKEPEKIAEKAIYDFTIPLEILLYLVNGEHHSLTVKERDNADSTLTCLVEANNGTHYTIERTGEPYFCHNPDFLKYGARSFDCKIHIF